MGPLDGRVSARLDQVVCRPFKLFPDRAAVVPSTRFANGGSRRNDTTRWPLPGSGVVTVGPSIEQPIGHVALLGGVRGTQGARSCPFSPDRHPTGRR